jgi:hypothetical protein
VICSVRRRAWSISPETVSQVELLLAQDKLSHKKIGLIVGISRQTIDRIADGSWKADSEKSDLWRERFRRQRQQRESESRDGTSVRQRARLSAKGKNFRGGDPHDLDLDFSQLDSEAEARLAAIRASWTATEKRQRLGSRGTPRVELLDFTCARRQDGKVIYD